jgi:hypothetical protein
MEVSCQLHAPAALLQGRRIFNINLEIEIVKDVNK